MQKAGQWKSAKRKWKKYATYFFISDFAGDNITLFSRRENKVILSPAKSEIKWILRIYKVNNNTQRGIKYIFVVYLARSLTCCNIFLVNKFDWLIESSSLIVSKYSRDRQSISQPVLVAKSSRTRCSPQIGYFYCDCLYFRPGRIDSQVNRVEFFRAPFTLGSNKTLKLRNRANINNSL